MSFSVSAQKWVDAIELQQTKIQTLQNKMFASNQRILELDAKGGTVNLNSLDIHHTINTNLEAVQTILTNLRIQQMLFEMITSSTQITNAKKLLDVRKSQLILELSLQAAVLQKQAKLSKDDQTTGFIFDARDLVISTRDLINTSFKY
jgi:hypothetical protein